MQFLLIQLKVSAVIEWKWFSVLALSLVVLCSAAIASLTLLAYWICLLARSFTKRGSCKRGNGR